ncbi:MAG: DUF58 domain-containing protein [Phycisphaerales bacterium]|nr:DUF58 domain-containing protein [Phycisphaerales bacterium]
MIVSGVANRPSRLEDLLDARLLARLDRLDVRSLKMFPGKLQGERRSKKRGQSVEFDDYRPYVPGDDLRFIDWNVYARFERLFVKLFLEEQDLALHVAIDASASMHAGAASGNDGWSKLLFASRLAAALGYIGLVNSNRVGMTVFGRAGQDAPVMLPDVRGRSAVPRMARFLLDAVWPEGEGPAVTGGRAGAAAEFNRALTAVAKARVGKGVMVVVSDFLINGGYEAGLRSLAAAGGYDTTCVQVLSPGELEPEKALSMGGDGAVIGDVRLTDVETGRASEITVTAELIRAYKKKLDAYTGALGQFCLAREMNHVLVRSDADLGEVITRTMRRVGVVG